MTEENILHFDVELPLKDEEMMKVKSRHMLNLLRPEWKSDITFECFSSGITNKVICAIGPKSDEEDPEKIIVRIFGQNTEKIIDRANELLNWRLMAEHGLAAKLLAKFSNGIICGFLRGKSLDTEAVRDPRIARRICERLASMHKIQVNHCLKQSCLFKQMEYYIANIPSADAVKKEEVELEGFVCYVISFVHHQQYEINSIQLSFGEAGHKGMGYLSNILLRTSFDTARIKTEPSNVIRWILIEKLDCPIVFSHNDLLIHNIIYDCVEDTINFVDYEYAGLNYQGFDIANHFCEYAGVENVDYNLCPNESEKRAWIRIYLENFLDRAPTDDEIDALLSTIGYFEAASHLFWSFWAAAQSQLSLVNFDYLEYASIRYKMYRKSLKKLLNR